MEGLHPGCMVATVTYQERIFDPSIKQMNVDYLLRTRERFHAWLGEVRQRHEARAEFDQEALADHLTAIVEGSIILSKALGDEALMGKQTRLFRNHVKLLFGA